jgi:heme/copper-type cytochrome/quinol oxidase subunit 2
MKKLIFLLITLITLINVSYASFPIDNSAVSDNNDPTTDSWIPIVIVFWLLVIITPIILIRFVKRSLKRNKDN